MTGPEERALSPFLLLFVENFLFGCALNATSLLPPYLVSLGASQTFVGFFNIVGTLLIVVVVVFFGRPLVRLPRVKSIQWGFFLLVASSGLSWLFADSLLLLAVLRIVGAVSQIFAWTLMMSLLLDQTPPEKRASSVALYGVSGILTNPVASMAGEAILKAWGGPGLFLLATGFSLASWLWSLMFREPPVRPSEEPQSFLNVLTRRDMTPLLVLGFVFGVYFTALMSFLPHHTQVELGEANLSAFLIPFSLISVAIRVVAGGQMDRKSPRRFLTLSYVGLLASMVCLLLPPTWFWLILSGLLYGVGHSILFPLLNALYVQKGGEHQKAVYSNAYMVANLVGAVVMTPLLGLLGDLVGFGAIAGVLAAAAALAILVVRKSFPKPEASPPSVHSS